MRSALCSPSSTDIQSLVEGIEGTTQHPCWPDGTRVYRREDGWATPFPQTSQPAPLVVESGIAAPKHRQGIRDLYPWFEDSEEAAQPPKQGYWRSCWVNSFNLDLLRTPVHLRITVPLGLMKTVVGMP